MDWGDTKMKTNPNSLPSTPAALLPYCRDLSEWPERWMGVEEDLSPGTRLVQYFMPFLLHLAASGLSKSTIQNHVDNMWLLGGEIIRNVNEEPHLRKVRAEQLVRNVIHHDGGPLIHHGWEDEQRSFDSTCRKFYRFLSHSQR
jgi:hypothetical protein